MAIKLKAVKCLLPTILDQQHMTAAELSIKTNISKSSISEYMHNRNKMSIDTAATIAYALNVNIKDLYEWELVE